MYNNSGVKIKNLASAMMVFYCIIALLIAILVGSITESLLIALLVFVVGAIISWLSYLLLYGFGDLVAETQYTREAIETLMEELESAGNAKKVPQSKKKKKSSEFTSDSDDLSGTAFDKASQVGPVGAFRGNSSFVPQDSPSSSDGTCPYCGKPLMNNYCSDCLAYFGNE